MQQSETLKHLPIEHFASPSLPPSLLQPTSQMGWCLWERAGSVQGLLKVCLRSLALREAEWAMTLD